MPVENGRKNLSRRRREAPRAAADSAAGANRLAPIRAFCASMGPSTRPQTASAVKFFSRGESRATNVIATAKARANSARCAHAQFNIAERFASKTRNPSAFLHRVEILVRERAAEKVFGARLCRRSLRVSAAAAGRGTYTQN